jgi:hypothetical protein
MISTDTDPGIESDLIDLSTVSFSHLRELNSSALHQAMRHALTRTGNLRTTYVSATGNEGGGERVD